MKLESVTMTAEKKQVVKQQKEFLSQDTLFPHLENWDEIQFWQKVQQCPLTENYDNSLTLPAMRAESFIMCFLTHSTACRASCREKPSSENNYFKGGKNTLESAMISFSHIVGESCCHGTLGVTSRACHLSCSHHPATSHHHLVSNL